MSLPSENSQLFCEQCGIRFVRLGAPSNGRAVRLQQALTLPAYRLRRCQRCGGHACAGCWNAESEACVACAPPGSDQNVKSVAFRARDGAVAYAAMARRSAPRLPPIPATVRARPSDHGSDHGMPIVPSQAPELPIDWQPSEPADANRPESLPPFEAVPTETNGHAPLPAFEAVPTETNGHAPLPAFEAVPDAAALPPSDNVPAPAAAQPTDRATEVEHTPIDYPHYPTRAQLELMRHRQRTPHYPTSAELDAMRRQLRRRRD